MSEGTAEAADPHAGKAAPGSDSDSGPLRVFAWTGWAAAAALTALNFALLVRNYDISGPTGGVSGTTEFVAGVGYLAVATIGVAIANRWPRNLAAWAFLGAGVALTLAAFASEYATYGVVTELGGVPGARWAAWLGAWAWWAGAAFGLTFTLLLYPDGRLPAPRWRWCARVALANTALLCVLHALTPGPLDGEFSIAVNPVGLDVASDPLRALRDLGWLFLLANAAIGTTAAANRARRSARPQRTALYLLAGAGVCTALAAVLWGVGGGGGGDGDAPSKTIQLLVALSVLAVPAAGTVAAATTASLQRSIERLVRAREEERMRIRRDLHDGLGPTLAGVGLQLDLAKDLIGANPAAVEEILARVTSQVKAAVADVRRLVDELRPPVLDQLGLVPAIEHSTSFLAYPANGCPFGVSVTSTGEVGGLPPAVEVAAFRIVMEAVTNACRHAKASTCEVDVTLDRELVITVEDDGVGVPRDPRIGVGLASMRERAAELGGTCRIEQRPGGGTVVRAQLPVTR